MSQAESQPSLGDRLTALSSTSMSVSWPATFVYALPAAPLSFMTAMAGPTREMFSEGRSENWRNCLAVGRWRPTDHCRVRGAIRPQGKLSMTSLGGTKSAFLLTGSTSSTITSPDSPIG